MINQSKINFVFKEVQLLSNKDQSTGYVPPLKFDSYVQMAQLDEVNSLLETYEGDTQSSGDADFLKKTIVASIPSNGEYTNPNDFLRWDSAEKYFTYTQNGVKYDSVTEVKLVKQNEVGLRLSTNIKRPTQTSPICILRGDKLKFYPTDIGDVYLNYLKIPNAPSWGYVLTNNRPVFNQASTVELEVGWDLIPNIIYRVCQYLGIQVKRLDLVQTMQNKINQETKG